MINSVSHVFNCEDLFKQILEFCSIKENVKTNVLVCKNWQKVATDVTKIQIVKNRIKEIETRSEAFRSMIAPQKLDEYCLDYKKFCEMASNENRGSHKLREIYDASMKLTEKKTVCMSIFFRVNPKCPNIPQEKKEWLEGKCFVSLHFKADEESWDGKPYSPRFFSYLPGIVMQFFPIELFKLSTTKDNEVIGDLNQGTFCFGLKGRIVELTLEEGEKEIREATWVGIPELNRKTAEVINLTPAHADRGHIWAWHLYVAKFDAKAETQSN